MVVFLSGLSSLRTFFTPRTDRPLSYCVIDGREDYLTVDFGILNGISSKFEYMFLEDVDM